MNAVVFDRAAWIATLDRIARPVLMAASEGRLVAAMPRVERAGRNELAGYEALARTLTGLSPWLVAEDVTDDEAAQQAALKTLAIDALGACFDPARGDFRFDQHQQQLVEAAFLSHAFLRAPKLWDALDPATQQRIVAQLVASRRFTPYANNWTLFAALVERFLESVNEPMDHARWRLGVDLHASWYLGDGIYGDGPTFHADYYNSLVIHPMLLDAHRDGPPAELLARAQRAAMILERLIGPDGTYPPLGRSLAYRVGVFHLLGQLALQRRLPDALPPAQVRTALSAVIDRCFAAPGTFDDGGFLTVGLHGHQPSVGEAYINAGSIYLVTAAFLPLGLPPRDPFWADPPRPFTQQRVFAGEDVAADHAL